MLVAYLGFVEKVPGFSLFSDTVSQELLILTSCKCLKEHLNLYATTAQLEVGFNVIYGSKNSDV